MMRTNKKIATQGFSLIEMMIALVVMAIGLLGMNLMFITAMATNRAIIISMRLNPWVAIFLK